MGQDRGKEITADDAKSIGRKYLLAKYLGSKVAFDKATLTAKGSAPVYQLEGKLDMPSRNPLSSIFSQHAQYTFKIEIHATKGTVLGYELV